MKPFLAVWKPVELAAVAIWIAAVLFVAAVSVPGPHPSESCFEDEAWTAVDYRTSGAYGKHSRKCVNIDELLEGSK